MPQWTLTKRTVIDALTDEFLHHYGLGRTFIAVDGLDGSGTARFADDLAERLGRGSHSVFRASIDRFHFPRAERYAHGDSADARYNSAFDYDLFRRVLIDPFALAGSTGFVTEAFDVERDEQIMMQWQTAPRESTLIIDGPFLNRPELRGLWNYSIWVESVESEQKSRLRPAGDPLHHNLAGAQALYFADANPRERASAIIDNTIVDAPRRVFADFC